MPDLGAERYAFLAVISVLAYFTAPKSQFSGERLIPDTVAWARSVLATAGPE
jgi:hypothetical protein